MFRRIKERETAMENSHGESHEEKRVTTKRGTNRKEGIDSQTRAEEETVASVGSEEGRHLETIVI